MMPFDADVREPEDAAAGLAAVLASTARSWVPAQLWTCPGCVSTVLTREAAPRCRRCGFWQGT